MHCPRDVYRATKIKGPTAETDMIFVIFGLVFLLLLLFPPPLPCSCSSFNNPVVGETMHATVYYIRCLPLGRILLNQVTHFLFIQLHFLSNFSSTQNEVVHKQ